jgi:hypothetical protein
MYWPISESWMISSANSLRVAFIEISSSLCILSGFYK